MILSCPSCATRYLIDSAKLGPEGRLVRCARCRHTWHQSSPEGVAIKVEPIPRMGEAAASEQLAASPTSELRPIPPGSNLPAFPPIKKRRSSALGWILLLLVLAGLAFEGYIARARVVEAWPPAARLYRLLGVMPAPLGDSLKIRNVTTERATEDGVPVLRIAGEVANVSRQSVDVPPLAATLRDARQRSVLQTLFKASESKLLPGETSKFSTTIKNPPSEATDVDVDFAPGA